jgi:error-prone DNA polymerase
MHPYTELHAHSYFSLLDGASSPEALVERAAALGMDALALTDHDAVYGAVRFAQAARTQGIQPIFGAELTLADDSHLTLLVRDATGWQNLCNLITLAHHQAPKGQARLPPDALEAHATGLIALSGCRQGGIAQALLHGQPAQARQQAIHYREVFGREGFWLELQHHLLPEDNRLNVALVGLAEAVRVNYAATNNVHYATPAARPLQDVLVCIRHHTTLDDCAHLRPNAEYALKSSSEMTSLFAAYPAALTQTRCIAAQCGYDLHFGLQELPSFPTPDGLSADAYLRRLCQQALPRLTEATPASAQLEHELAIIQTSQLANYFLIVWDIVRFATAHGILCQGRGSAANSLVAYLLGISPVNPLAHDLVFERFLSDERQVAPDIDMDFDAARREEVIQYVYQRYGTAHAAMACTLVTFRARSALRDVGKALGLPPELLAGASSALDAYDAPDLEQSAGLQEVLGSSRLHPTWSHALRLAQQLDGVPRHLGIHNGGMILTGAPLASRVPTEPATLEERVVVQWDKDSLETAGLVKIDILGLRMLSAVAEAETHVGDRAPQGCFDDPRVYDLIGAADTVGVFQVESRAQAQVLPRLQPRCFNDLIVTISLIRPGPVQGDMVHPYLRRRLGQEAVTYLHPALEPALRETLGVILFQEQVLKVARDFAGFTPGQGELLRRALGSSRAAAAIEGFQSLFVAGAQRKGTDRTTAEAVFERLRAFGGYSFPKSHAAAFAVLVYRSAWLKVYHPVAFYTALLNHQPMGFWSPSILVSDAKRRGIPTRGIDILHSAWKCTPEAEGIRLGFITLKGMSEAQATRLIQARAERPFRDLRDFLRRTRLPRRLTEALILAGAFDEWDANRRGLLWTLGTLHPDDALEWAVDPDSIQLPSLSQADEAAMEYAVTGIATGAHPLLGLRARLREQGILSSTEVEGQREGSLVQVAGLLVVHQAPPTAKGFRFLTLEDECGFLNVIVRPSLYPRYRRLIRAGGVLVVTGRMQREGGVVNVLAEQVNTL